MLKQPTLDLKAKTINVQKWPKKIRAFVGITWVKIIVAIFLYLKTQEQIPAVILVYVANL